MKRIQAIGLLGLLGVVFAMLVGCTSDDPIFPDEPTITFESITPTEVRPTSGLTDSTAFTVTLSFTDGDGDLGRASSADNTPNFFMQDLREELPAFIVNAQNQVDTVYFGELSFILPDLTPDARNPSIQGEIRLNLSAQVGRLRESGEILNAVDFPEEWATEVDTLSFSIYVLDRAGNRSNTVITRPVFLRPPA